MSHLEEAGRALGTGDLVGAGAHISSALGEAPLCPNTLDLAYRILSSTNDPVRFTALGDNASLDQAAFHAMGLAVAHQSTPAMEILWRVATQRPATPVLPWAEAWIEQHPAALLIDLETVGPCIGEFADSFEEPVDSDDPRHRNLIAAATILERLRQTFTDLPVLTLRCSKFLRLAKDFDRALAMARHTQAQDPYLGQMLEAWTYRDMDHAQDAINAFQRAYEVRADDSILLDTGDLQLGQGEFERAVQTYGRVQPNTEDHAWANAHQMACQYLISGDARWLASLSQLAATRSEAASQALRKLNHFREVHDEPADLTVGLVRSTVDRLRGGQTSASQPATLKVTISNPESPTVTRCFEFAMNLIGQHANLVVAVEKVPSPDPRLPLDVVLGAQQDVLAERYALWKWEGTDPVVVAPAPSQHVSQAVGSLAQQPLLWDQWHMHAAQLAPHVANHVPEVVWTCVHPPYPASADEDPISWMYRVQLAAALILSKVDGGWAGSKRREALLGMVHGPVDWPIAVAIPVLEAVYKQEPSARPEILDTFQRLHQRVPTEGYTCYRRPLYACWLRLEGIDLQARRALWRLYQSACKKPYL